jgi:mono/diheme cytochrome c family protein
MDVLPILKANCYSCHSANEYQVNSGGTLNMEKFSELKAYTQVASGHGDVSALLGNIRQEPGFNPMPQGGGKLDDCKIAIIKAWIDQGAPQN